MLKAASQIEEHKCTAFYTARSENIITWKATLIKYCFFVHVDVMVYSKTYSYN